MKDTNFVDILPFDVAEILDEEPSLPKFGFQVVGLSKSRNVVTLGLLDDEGLVTKTVERPPYRVHIRVQAGDPRAGAKHPASNTMEEKKRFLSILEAFVKKRAGDFDEWQAAEPKE